MEIRKVDSSANELLDGPQADKSELAAKIQRLHIFFSLLIPDMNHEERQLLDEALIQTYRKKELLTTMAACMTRKISDTIERCQFWEMCTTS